MADWSVAIGNRNDQKWRPARLATSLLALMVAAGLQLGPVMAAGGNGAGLNPGQGGATNTTTAGGNGTSADSNGGGGGGGGGGTRGGDGADAYKSGPWNGGDGGAGGASAGANGGSGGNGVEVFEGGAGGGGGGGAHGLVLFDGTVGSDFTGGNGGAGGHGATRGHGGGGGGGAYGAVLGGTVTILDGVTIAGGSGGTGGRGGNGALGETFAYMGGDGGDGGAGVALITGAVLTNNGTIIGGGRGTGGQGGNNNGYLGSNGDHGTAGAGVIGHNITVINNGIIRGNALSPHALRFTGDANTLTLGASGVIEGGINVSGRLNLAHDADRTLSSVISGDGGITKTGAGTLTLSGDSTFTGGVEITEGTLEIGHINALGHYFYDPVLAPDSAFTRIADGAVLVSRVSGDLGAFLDFSEGDTRFAVATGEAVTLTGTIWADVPTGLAGSTIHLGSAEHAGTIYLAPTRVGFAPGGSPIAGYLSIDGGTVVASDVGGQVFLYTRQWGLNVSSGAALEIDGSLEDPTTLFNLSGDGTIRNHSDSDLTLHLHNFAAEGHTTGNSVFSGILEDGAGTLALEKAGEGTLTLSGANTYSGGTKVSEGVLVLKGDGASLGSGAVINDTQLVIDNDGTRDFGNAVSGSGMLLKRGDGTVTLTGVNTHSGGTVLEGGTLSIASDTSLGDSVGELAFHGGALKVTADETIGRDLDFHGDAIIEVADGKSLLLDGTVSGDGGLVKRGEGELALGFDGGYGGHTLVLAGRLVGDADSIGGNLGNAGEVVFDQAVAGSFAGTIAGTADADGGMVKRGAGALRLLGTSELDWTIEAGELIAMAQQFSGNAAIEAGSGLAFDQSVNALYAGLLSGDGSFDKRGAGAVTLTGNSSAFGGMTTVAAGGLVVGDGELGQLGGDILVESGAWLGGTGSLGGIGNTVRIAGGGRHAPGNSIGTQYISADYINHGILEIEATPDDADRLVVDGIVDISGATLALQLQPANAASWNIFNGPFTIIENRGSQEVVGQFGAIDPNLLFLDSYVSYDGGTGGRDVTLELVRNNVAFAGIAQTRNQRSTGEAIDTLGTDDPLWRSVALTGDADQVRASFDALSGEVHASTHTVLLEDSRLLRQTLNDRVRSAFGEVPAVTPLLSYAPEADPILVGTQEGLSVWAKGFGAWGMIDGDGNAAALDYISSGMLLGADGRLGDLRVGLAAGYSQSRFDIEDRQAAGHSDNYHVALYGGTEWQGVGIRGGLAYSRHDIEISRAVDIPGVNNSLDAAYGAQTLQVFAEAGHNVDLGALRLEPFANIAHVRVNVDAFGETGGDAAIVAGGGHSTATFTTLGVRGEYQFTSGDARIALTGGLSWRHALGDVTPLSTHVLANSASYTIAGVPIARNSAIVDAGLELDITPEASFGLFYSGQLAADATDHQLGLKFSSSF